MSFLVLHLLGHWQQVVRLPPVDDEVGRLTTMTMDVRHDVLLVVTLEYLQLVEQWLLTEA